jgi:hypothetical protein
MNPATQKILFGIILLIISGLKTGIENNTRLVLT